MSTAVSKRVTKGAALLPHAKVVEMFADKSPKARAVSKRRETTLLKGDVERDPERTLQLAKEQTLKGVFLLAYAKGGTIGGALVKAKITRGLVERWIEEDQLFAETLEQYDENLTDTLEEVAIKRAKKKSDTLLIRLLEARRPSKFKQTAGPQVNITNNEWVIGENVVKF